jgi:hypothetical protein
LSAQKKAIKIAYWIQVSMMPYGLAYIDMLAVSSFVCIATVCILVLYSCAVETALPFNKKHDLEVTIFEQFV